MSRKLKSRNRSGRAILPNIVEDIDVSPSGKPSPDDCYTIPLHNSDRPQTLSVHERWGKRSRGCYG